MLRLRGREDCPRAIASVHAFLESKQLRVISIDHVNTGLDCWYHTVRLGVVGEPADSLCGFIDGQALPAVALKNMTPAQMRNAAANTVNWLLDTNLQGFGAIKESVHHHIDVEARVDDGPQGANRVQENASFEQGFI
jgi:hypothetical protein